MQRVGVIGLGIMGRGMAACLLRAGNKVVVYNRTAARAEPLRVAGAEVAASPAALAARVDVVVLCVTDEAAVEAVLGGPDGVLAAVRRPAQLIDCSTIDPDACIALERQARAAGVALVDAPVSGGSEGAADGTLAAMVGGTPEDVARARLTLAHFCRTVVHVGPVGAGQRVKLMNQILVVGHALAMSEALTFGLAGGVDPALALEAIAGGAGASWMLAHRGPQVLAADWRPGFTIDMQQKDLRLVLAAAARQGTPLLGTALAQQLYAALQARGLGEEGNHALIKAVAALAPPRAPDVDGRG